MNEEWVPITSFIVKYPKGDLFGKLLAYSSLTPFAIGVAYATLIVMVRDVRVVFLFAGQVINALLCLILKQIVKQERPPHDEIYLKIYGKSNHGFGMPSQHSQFQAYFSVFLIMYLSTLKPETRLSRLFFLALKLLLLVSCLIIVYSRVYLVYHYWLQCIVGVMIGSIWAFIWFKIDQLVMEKFLYKKIINWNISKLLHLTYANNDRPSLNKKSN